MGKNFGKIWIVTAIIFFMIEAAWGMSMTGVLHVNKLLPWRTSFTYRGWMEFAISALVMSVGFTYIFLQGYKGKGWMEGVRFGIWVTILAAVPWDLAYGTMLPMGKRIPLSFMVGDLVALIVCGVVAAALAGTSAAGRSASA